MSNIQSLKFAPNNCYLCTFLLSKADIVNLMQCKYLLLLHSVLKKSFFVWSYHNGSNSFLCINYVYCSFIELVHTLKFIGATETNLMKPKKKLSSIKHYCKKKVLTSTGKSLSEALILASTNPQYDKGLFMELLTMKTTSAEHEQNMGW